MRRISWVGLAALPVLLAGSTAAQTISINAAGATFPGPIYQKWFQNFKEAQINYQAIGSGGGIRQLTAGTVDFGASDMPMTDAQIGAMKVKPLHFPTVLGAVVPVYNIPGVSGQLNFSSEAMAGIFLGDIKKWNDPRIAKANPGVKLPNDDIITVHRSDGSGTTFVWVDYLYKISPAWAGKVGKPNASIQWPASGLAGNGNPGVAGTVKQTPDSIGYVELVYAKQNKMTYGAVQNKAGKFVLPSVESVTAAAAGAANQIPADFRVSITNADGKDAYPISSFTYLLIPSKIADARKKKAIVDFLQFMLADGQKDAPALDYSPLPSSIVGKEKKQIAQIM